MIVHVKASKKRYRRHRSLRRKIAASTVHRIPSSNTGTSHTTSPQTSVPTSSGIDSLTALSLGAASRRDDHRYTGKVVKGVSLLHKQSYTPVTDESALHVAQSITNH